MQLVVPLLAAGADLAAVRNRDRRGQYWAIITKISRKRLLAIKVPLDEFNFGALHNNVTDTVIIMLDNTDHTSHHTLVTDLKCALSSVAI